MKENEDAEIRVNAAMNTVLWVVGALDELIKTGLVAGGSMELTSKGVAGFDQLDMEFQPDDVQITDALKALNIDDASQSGIFKFLKLFRDDRENFVKGVQDGKD